jgi:hypothetical protein
VAPVTSTIVWPQRSTSRPSSGGLTDKSQFRIDLVDRFGPGTPTPGRRAGRGQERGALSSGMVGGA